MATKTETFKTSGDMLAWQFRQTLAQLDQVQLHASDPTCPCRLRDEGEYCIPKHLNLLSSLANETAAMDDKNSELLYDLGEDAAQQHLKTKDHVCSKGESFDLVTWARQWRKKIEPIYYACPGKRAKLKDVEHLFAPVETVEEERRRKWLAANQNKDWFRMSRRDFVAHPPLILTFPDEMSPWGGIAHANYNETGKAYRWYTGRDKYGAATWSIASPEQVYHRIHPETIYAQGKLLEPFIRIAGKCDGEEDCAFKVSHTEKITLPAGSLLTLPQTVQDVLKALERHDITASDMTFAYGTTGLFKYELKFRIEDAEKLIFSHNVFTGEENPKFPPELQPRDRTREASKLQVQNIAKNMNPDLLLVDFRSTDRGAPIIYRDMVVESGNGRTMAIVYAADQVKDKFEEYRNALRQIAPAYALDPAQVDRYRVPVLVRERLTEVNSRKSFVEDCNARTGLAMSEIEQARRDAEKITLDMLNIIEVLEGETFEDALRAPRNNVFLAKFLELLPANDRAELVDAKGVISTKGVRRAIMAIFVSTFKGDAGLRLATSQFEALDPDVRVALAGIAGSLGFLAKAENLTQSKAREPELSIGEDLAVAIKKWGQIRRIEDYTVEKYFAQQQLGQLRELTPFQERLLKVLAANARSAKRIAGILSGYAMLVIDSPPPGQTSMMSNIRPTKPELFEAAVRAVVQEVEAKKAEAAARKEARELSKETKEMATVSDMAELFDVERLDAATKQRVIPKEQMDLWGLKPLVAPSGSRPESPMPTALVPVSKIHAGWSLDPCQKAGVEWLKGRSFGLLADDMGIGKTAQAIFWGADRLPCLVVVPPSLFYNWQREIQENWRIGDTVTMLEGDATLPKTLTDWTIVPMSQLGKFTDQLRRAGFKSIIVDEAHKIKNLDAQRTEHLLALVTKEVSLAPDPSFRIIPNRLAVTGTPIINHPIELFPILVFLGKFDLGDFKYFLKKYARAVMVHGRRVYVGAQNLDQLNEYLGGFMLRRLKEECLADLPPKRHTPMFVAISNAREYQIAERNFITWLKAKKGDEAAMRAASAQAIVKMNELRHLAAIGKVDAVSDWLKPCEDGRNKVIVFSSFVDTISELSKRKGSSVLYTGAVNKTDRQGMVDRFQRDANLCFFMGTTPAAGVGITLTAANRVVFMDLPWTPGDKRQAEDRAHRRGQKNPVEIVNILAKGTIDERMLQILAAKEVIIAQAVDGKTALEAQQESVAVDLLKSYMGGTGLMDVPCYEKELPDTDVVEIDEAQVDRIVYRHKAPKMRTI